MATPLYSHQIEAVPKLKNGSVLVGGTGSGKSMTALAYFLVSVCGAGSLSERGWEADYPKNPRPLYIITTARKRDSLDWETEAARYGISTDSDISIGGIRLVVDSWNNIKNYADVTDAFFVFDEQRIVGSGVWAKTFLKIAKVNQWILLSATPGDTWIDYVPLFLAHGFYKNRTEFEHHHVVYKRFAKFPMIDRYLGEDVLMARRDSILVDMPDMRHTVRHLETVMCDYPRGELLRATKTRFNPYTQKPMKGAGELCQVARRIVLTDPSRQRALLELMETHPRIVVFYNYNYELDALKGLLEPLTTLAEWNGHKHEEVPVSNSWCYLVQYAAGSEAWNCTTTDTVVFYSLNYSYKVTEQSMGRIDRMNTPYTDLYYYRFVSNAWIDKGVMRALEQKKNFSEARFGVRMWGKNHG